MFASKNNLSVLLGQYTVEHKSTVRATAKEFGISKSAVHKILTKDLQYESAALYKQVRVVLENNLAERHIRGGIATRNAFKLKREAAKA